MEPFHNEKSSIHNLAFTALTIIILISLNQCGSKSQPVPEAEYGNINSDALKVMMENKDFTLINVHIPYAGDIPGTDMSIPFNEIGEKLDLPKDSKIVLYCRSGPMSENAAKTLIGRGYANVFNLKNGMAEWQQEGNELATTPNR